MLVNEEHLHEFQNAVVDVCILGDQLSRSSSMPNNTRSVRPFETATLSGTSEEAVSRSAEACFHKCRSPRGNTLKNAFLVRSV